jgi:hypothetical protein
MKIRGAYPEISRNRNSGQYQMLFLFNMSWNCKEIDHESISTIWTPKEITNEETDIDRKISHSYLTYLEVVREPVMNRYRHDIIDIDTKRNHKWEKRSWIDICTISTKNVILIWYVKQLNGNRLWFDINMIPSISTPNEIANEEANIDRKKTSFVFITSSSCKGTDHESISTRYHRCWQYRHKKKSQMIKPILSRYRLKKSFLFDMSSSLNGNRLWIDINMISSI